MQKHPDADAFVRAYLEQPADAVSRLVFADWLEETGEPHNAAWAHFLRLKVEADQHPPDSAERRKLDRRADAHAPRIRAKLTVSAQQFVDYPKALLQLLPAPNVTVRLANFTVARPVLEYMPESVARENLVLPLDMQGRTLLTAAVNPRDTNLAEKLEFILNCDIVLVCAARDDVWETINRHYGQTETESVDSVSYESPLIGLEGDTISRDLFGVFYTAFSGGADGFVMELDPEGCAVRYFADRQLLREEHFGAEVHERLLAHLLSLEPDAQTTRNGIVSDDLDVPLLSGRRFPVTFTRREVADRNRWFRLHFRW